MVYDLPTLRSPEVSQLAKDLNMELHEPTTNEERWYIIEKYFKRVRAGCSRKREQTLHELAHRDYPDPLSP